MNTTILQIGAYNQKPGIAGSRKTKENITASSSGGTSEADAAAASTGAKDQLTDDRAAELTISEEAAEQQKEQQERALKEEYQDQAEAAQEAGKAFADTAKLMEIARRISRGDKVPFKDEKKLLEFNPKLYQAAKSAAMLHMHEKHKKYKSMFEDEDELDMREKLRDLNQDEEKSEAIDEGPSEDAADTEADQDMGTE